MECTNTNPAVDNTKYPQSCQARLLFRITCRLRENSSFH